MANATTYLKRGRAVWFETGFQPCRFAHFHCIFGDGVCASGLERCRFGLIFLSLRAWLSKGHQLECQTKVRSKHRLTQLKKASVGSGRLGESALISGHSPGLSVLNLFSLECCVLNKSV